MLRRSRVPLQHQISLAHAIVYKEAVTAIQMFMPDRSFHGRDLLQGSDRLHSFLASIISSPRSCCSLLPEDPSAFTHLTLLSIDRVVPAFVT